MSSNSLHPKTASNSLSSDEVLRLCDILELLLNPKRDIADDVLYSHIRVWVNSNKATCFDDPRTTVLCDKISAAIVKGALDIYSDAAFHSEVLRFIAENKTPSSEHALEFLDDLDYVKKTLGDIAQLSEKLAVYFFDAGSELVESESNSSIPSSLNDLLKIGFTTCQRIHQQSLQAADSVVSGSELAAQLSVMDEPVILCTQHYTITKKGAHPWLSNNDSGEGLALSHDHLQRVLNAADYAITHELTTRS